jgi:hypothetical protein
MQCLKGVVGRRAALGGLAGAVAVVAAEGTYPALRARV